MAETERAINSFESAVYPGVSTLLRQARPRDLLGFVDQSCLAGFNEEHEGKLRKAPEVALSLSHAQAHSGRSE